MSTITVTKNRYIVSEPLRQWDKNQILKIYGLSLGVIPEIHFTNDSMDGAIVRQSTVDASGVISVEVPNSLLQKSHKITVFVCTYEGDSFRSLYEILVPVKARKKPLDYTIEDTDGEIYSFKALNNKIDNLTVDMPSVKAAANNAVTTANAAKKTAEAAKQTAESFGETIEQATTDASEAKTTATEAKNTASKSVPKSGGSMTGTLTLKGIKLTEGVDYGDELPSNATAGKLFFKRVTN